ncbi:hypothetical protein Tco_0513574 [Tanacetum coccineum]
MLLRRTIMQKMRMVVLMIHGAVKFHTTQGIEIVFSTHESDKIRDGVKKIIETSPANTEGVLSCTDVEEKIVVNRKINADAFAWTHADMKRILRTITVDGNPFNTEHKLNEYSHIKPIKQKRRSLGLDHSTTARKEVEELTKAGILWEAALQTWVANPFMAKKSDEGWRMFVDEHGNRWMRYEDGGESIESDDGEWWWFEGWFGSKTMTCPLRRGATLEQNLKEAKRDNDRDTAITKAGTKFLLHRAHFSCSWDILGISALKVSAADT